MQGSSYIQAASTSGALAPGSMNADGARTATSIRRHVLEFQDCITAIEKCEKPVISILHGISFGLGMDISLAADIRLCTASTKFSVKEADLGLAADIGTLSRLPKAVASFSWVKDVCMTARIFGADEALRVGLVSEVLESKAKAVERAVEIASLIGSKSPVAVQGTKEVLNYSRDHSVNEGLNYVAVWNSAMLQTQDVKDAMTAGLQKRTPKFSKLYR
ncbi:hypothetical protein B0A49_04799 [Cryomyces minteri]|uniref:Uncharacterized protein n=1 Tax=Cryomyces minteri TaxID=331657 RepID=A0A4U0XDS4_9PEZI|nr:hypothetical protein B0A49_04799 [Cryomyces minteri]